MREPKVGDIYKMLDYDERNPDILLLIKISQSKYYFTALIDAHEHFKENANWDIDIFKELIEIDRALFIPAYNTPLYKLLNN